MGVSESLVDVVGGARPNFMKIPILHALKAP